jgi:hypothetical protein
MAIDSWHPTFCPRPFGYSDRNDARASLYKEESRLRAGTNTRIGDAADRVPEMRAIGQVPARRPDRQIQQRRKAPHLFEAGWSKVWGQRRATRLSLDRAGSAGAVVWPLTMNPAAATGSGHMD